MKKLGLLAMAFALLMGMSQCKKENANTPANEGEKVPITLNVGGSAKHEVTPETGEVTFTSGDVLYVASNGIYVGTLTYNGTVFCGDIIEPTEGQKLHFYFLGNVTLEESLTEGTSTGCSVVISDQTESLPVISYNASRENYQVGKTDYNATLLNKCVLVKFDVTSVVPNQATYIMGLNNQVTVDFGTNEFTYEQMNDGIITLAAGEGEHWAILLPQEEIADAEVRSFDGLWAGACVSVPAIAENDYLTEGIAVAITHPTGAINSLFSVSASQQVYFSRGNLQYIGSAATPYWKFAENQWAYIGSSSGQNSSSQTANRDLFGWATSGYNHGGISYQPWATDTNDKNYYAYGQSSYNLYGQTGQADWGYNAIANGGNQENSGWRTLTKNEWGYLFNTRTDAASKYGHGKVNGKNGLIILPDEWTLPDGISFTPGKSAWANVYSVAEWAQMEANGAVFLPAAGHRSVTSVYSAGSVGYYWSSEQRTNGFFAYELYFFSNNLRPQSDDTRHTGHSVRLVRNN